MSWPLSCSLLGWAAWAPGVATPEQWQAWAHGKHAITDSPDTPPVDFIPALQRRRLSRLSRLALAAAYACEDSNPAIENRHRLPTVFASRHGEIHRTVGLLTDLANDEPLSPMAFSLSVHNTASGLYSITSGNTAPSTAIAAGLDTLPMAFIEAIGQLQRHEEVMLVYAEEPLPDDYQPFAPDDDSHLLGLALRLGKASGKHTLSLQPSATEHTADSASGLSLLRFLANSDLTTLHTVGERSGWRWSWQ